VHIVGSLGQHHALIDAAVQRRQSLVDELGIEESQIASWAVCDEDTMTCSYSNLKQYADEKKINLAFSSPQFESFLLQHFEPSGDQKQSVIVQKMDEYSKQYCGQTRFEKGNISWIADAIDNKPKLVDVAITNSTQRNKASKRPFLTVHHLAEYLRSLRV
jgi:hypothetical protein